MINKKGFTLIELLAVIVVLAIIALIATPIVMNTIKKSQKGAAERGADNYIEAVETAVATAKLDSDGVPDGTYTIDENGNLLVPSLSDGKLTIEMNGNKPKSGTITIKNGQVTNDSKMIIERYTLVYNSGLKKYEAIITYKSGEVVYFNVTTGTKCSLSDYTETQSNTGVKEGCMKFYVFNDDGAEVVNLLLDHNTTATVAWNSTDKDANGNSISTKGPKEVLEELKSDTSSWQGIETPSNYTMNQAGQISNVKYTIDYSSYKARLITANEIAQITGNTSWNENTANTIFYFDTNTTTESNICKSGNTNGCQYGWLYDRTSVNCTSYGCLNNSNEIVNGYWTVSSAASTSSYFDRAWYVHAYSYLGNHNGVGGKHYGVRPVIEVLRSKLK